MSNTAQLHFVARLIMHAPRPLHFYRFFLRPFISHYALTVRLPRSHCALRDLINSIKSTLSMFSFVLQVFVNEQCFQKVAREDIKARKWVALMLALSVW